LGTKAYEIGTIGFVKNRKKKHIPDKIVALEMMVRSEITKRNFTKRQQNILMFICNYSLTFGKRSAVIPQIQDFEVCGISKTKAREEIDKLVDMNVIDWNMDENRFSIKKPFEWNVPFHSGYRDMRTQELFFINFKDAKMSIEDLAEDVRELKREDST
jgi:hypothetical protein